MPKRKKERTAVEPDAAEAQVDTKPKKKEKKTREPDATEVEVEEKPKGKTVISVEETPPKQATTQLQKWYAQNEHEAKHADELNHDFYKCLYDFMGWEQHDECAEASEAR